MTLGKRLVSVRRSEFLEMPPSEETAFANHMARLYWDNLWNSSKAYGIIGFGAFVQHCENLSDLEMVLLFDIPGELLP